MELHHQAKTPDDVAVIDERVLSTATRNPTMAALLTAGGVTAAGTGQAEPPNELETSRREERTARTAHETALKRQAELQAAFDRFDPARITGLSPAERERAVRQIQEELSKLTDERRQPLYRGRIDGAWGGQTTEAAAARRAQLERELETARAAVEAANKNLEGRGSRVRSFEREERVRAAENNLPWWARFARDYNLPLSLAAGGLAGPLIRGPTRRGVEGLRDRNVTAGNNALTMGAGDESVGSQTSIRSTTAAAAQIRSGSIGDRLLAFQRMRTKPRRRHSIRSATRGCRGLIMREWPVSVWGLALLLSAIRRRCVRWRRRGAMWLPPPIPHKINSTE